MARCKQTTRPEGGRSPRKTIHLEPRPVADDVSSEAKQQEEGMRERLLPAGYTTSGSDGEEEHLCVSTASKGSAGESESTDGSPQYSAPKEVSSPSSSECGKTVASVTDDWSGNTTDIEDTKGSAGHAQKSVIATEPGRNVSPPSGGPYYIQLSGSGYVEISVPQDRLVWEEESGEETEDATGKRKIQVTGETSLDCLVTQQVYDANGAHYEQKWPRPLGGMCNWWWWTCTIAYRCIRCV
jgi:hypothetical protein